MASVFVGVILFLVLFGLFIGAYKLNKATCVPEGVTEYVCGSCGRRDNCNYKV